MKIGIISDSHGNVPALRWALDELLGRGAEAIVHCGDLGSAECLALLGAADVDAYAVAGNMDLAPRSLADQASRCGVRFAADSVVVPLGEGKYLAATHGNKPQVLQQLIDGGDFPYVCCGHTHEAADERTGPVRVINPGPLDRASQPTAALLDTAADTVEHFRRD